MTLADILVVMNGGQVEQIGNPLDIYQKPATTFVASFIGAPPMNLMPLRSDETQIATGRRCQNQRGRHPRHPARGFRHHERNGCRRRGARPHRGSDRARRRRNLHLRHQAAGSAGRRRHPRRTAARRGDRADSRRRRPGHRRANQGGGRHATSCICLPPTAASGWADTRHSGRSRPESRIRVRLRAPGMTVVKPAAADLRSFQRRLNPPQITPIFPGDRTASRPAG